MSELSVPSRLQPQSLNGLWQFQPDPDSRGQEDNWAADPSVEYGLTAPVPAVWQTVAPDYEGVAWYRREVTLPAAEPGERRWLRFHAVDYLAHVWLAGRFLGEHEGGFTPFLLEIPEDLPAGEPLPLVVRVSDPPMDNQTVLDGARLSEIPSGKQAWYGQASGIWQDVDLFVTGPVCLENPFFRPCVVESCFDFDVEAQSAAGRSLRLQIELVEDQTGSPAGSFDSGDLTPADDPALLSGRLTLDVPPRLWSLQDPFLYRATLRLYVEGRLSDVWSLRLGLREFLMGEKQFFLNGVPVRLFANLNQQWHPLNSLAPPDEAGFREEMQRHLDGGFNCIRMHIRPCHPRFLELADEMGLLIYEESPLGWITASPHLSRRAGNDLREMILRDRNHPSLVLWGLFNEGSTRGQAQADGSSTLFFDETGPGPWAIVSELIGLFRELDPTRPVSEDSGGLYFNRYYVPGEDPPRRVLDHHAYKQMPTPDVTLHELAWQWGNPHQVYFLSEYGCASLPRFDDLLARFRALREAESRRQGRELPLYPDEAMYARDREDWLAFHRESLASFLPDPEEAVEQTRRLQALTAKEQTNAFRLNPHLAALTITQLTDAGSEYLGGLTDLFRVPKPALHAMGEALRPVYPALLAVKSNLYPGETGLVHVAALNDSQTAQDCVLRVWVGDAGEESLYERYLRLAPGERHQVCVETPSLAHSGSVPVHAALTGPTGDLAHNVCHLQVIDPGQFPTVPAVTVEDFTGDWLHTNLANHLSSRQIPSNPDQPLILVAPVPDLPTLHGARMREILAAVQSGATAVLFGLPFGQEPLPEGERRCFCKATAFRNELFEFPLAYRTVTGGFLGHFHFLPPHPVFTGLPSGCVLGPTYRNVVPSTGVELEEAERLVRAYSTPVGYHGVLRRSGCQATVRIAEDLAVVPCGSGKLVFCQFDLVPHLGRDPVADRLLCNLINWLSGAAGADSGERVVVEVMI